VSRRREGTGFETSPFVIAPYFGPEKSKLKLCWSIIRRTVTYGCETWGLKETIKKQVNGI